MDEPNDKLVSVRMNFPGHVSNDRIELLLSRIKSLVDEQELFLAFDEQISLDGDWEDEDGIHYWNP